MQLSYKEKVDLLNRSRIFWIRLLNSRCRVKYKRRFHDDLFMCIRFTFYVPLRWKFLLRMPLSLTVIYLIGCMCCTTLIIIRAVLHSSETKYDITVRPIRFCFWNWKLLTDTLKSVGVRICFHIQETPRIFINSVWKSKCGISFTRKRKGEQNKGDKISMVLCFRI